MYSYLVKPRRMGQDSDSPQDPIGSPDKREKRLEIGGMRWLSGFSRSIASVDCVLILIQELQSKCSVSEPTLKASANRTLFRAFFNARKPRHTIRTYKVPVTPRQHSVSL